jgi:hypothetical protein
VQHCCLSLLCCLCSLLSCMGAAGDWTVLGTMLLCPVLLHLSTACFVLLLNAGHVPTLGGA